MRDSVWAVQNDQYRDIIVTNQTLLWAETRRMKRVRGGTLVPHIGSKRRLLSDTYLFYVVNFVHLNAMIHYFGDDT